GKGKTGSVGLREFRLPPALERGSLLRSEQAFAPQGTALKIIGRTSTGILEFVECLRPPAGVCGRHQTLARSPPGVFELFPRAKIRRRGGVGAEFQFHQLRGAEVVIGRPKPVLSLPRLMSIRG